MKQKIYEFEICPKRTIEKPFRKVTKYRIVGQVLQDGFLTDDEFRKIVESDDSDRS